MSTVSVIIGKLTKTFKENAYARTQVSGGIQTIFGYYFDVEKEFGRVRVTEKLKSEITLHLNKENFFNVQFFEGGGVSAQLDLKVFDKVAA